MKKQTHAKKIMLSRETLRHLEGSALRGPAGGTSDASNCFTNCYTDCNTCQIDSCIRCEDSLSCAVC